MQLELQEGKHYKIILADRLELNGIVVKEHEDFITLGDITISQRLHGVTLTPVRIKGERNIVKRQIALFWLLEETSEKAKGEETGE